MMKIVLDDCIFGARDITSVLLTKEYKVQPSERSEQRREPISDAHGWIGWIFVAVYRAFFGHPMQWHKVYTAGIEHYKLCVKYVDENGKNDELIWSSDRPDSLRIKLKNIAAQLPENVWKKVNEAMFEDS